MRLAVLTPTHLIRCAKIFQNLLGKVFAFPVGIRAVASGMVFSQGQELRDAIHRRRWAVYKVENIMISHDLKKYRSAGYIVLVVMQRQAAWFPNCLQCGEVNDTIDFVL